MARIETDPNYSTPTFSRATAGTDIFKMTDVQGVAAALSTHVHDGTGKGLPVTTVAPGSITAAGLAANAVSQRAAVQIGTGSTTSTSFVDIPGLSASLTTTGGDLLAFACVNISLPGTASAFLALNLDGVDVSLASVQSTGVQALETMMVYRWVAPAAGTHTIKGRWCCSPSINLSINGNVNSVLLIEEMKK